MNKFDDFLKNKMSNDAFDVPSNWKALNSALPAQTAGKSIARWALALLLLGGMVTTALVWKNNTFVVKNENNTPVPKDSPGRKMDKTEPIVSSPETNQNVPVSSIQQKTSAGIESPVQPLIYGTPQTQDNQIREASVNPPVTNVQAVTEKQEFAPIMEKKEDEMGDMNTKAPSLMNKKDKVSKSKGIEKITTHKPSQRSDFHKGKLYIGMSFSPMLSYRSFQLTDGSAPFVNKQYDEIRQNSESKIISYGSALTLEYKFSKSFSLQGGISYNKIGFKSQYEFEVTDKVITDNTGRITGYEGIPNPVSTLLNNKTRIDVLRIPFGINYNLFMNANSLFHFYFGGSHNILLAAEGVGVNSLTLEQKPISKSDFTKNAKEVCIDLGINIALTPKYAFGVDLYYNKWLGNISKSKLENVTPFTAGLNLAISRKIF